MGTVAEVEAKHIDAGQEERTDHLRAGAGRSEGGHDLGVASASNRHWLLASAAIRTALKSFTLVKVGPVITESPSASKNPCPSLSARLSFGLMPLAQARSRVSGATYAPAISSRPSTPSVSPASAWIPGFPSSAIASESRNSTLRPPRPW